MRRAPPLRLVLLLLGLLAALCVYAGLSGRVAAPEARLVQGGFAELPAVELPEGELLAAFQRARPASLQLELRAQGLDLNLGPLATGTGFFISADGLVLTAYHVVDASPLRLPGREQIAARGPDGRRYPLTLVGFDAYRDLALLQADLGGAPVPYLGLAREPLTVGSEIVAIGNSRGDFLAARAGRVQRLGVEAVRADFATGTTELSASLAPGDSGGPVLSAAGEVVGVVSYIALNPRGPARLPLLSGLRPESGFASYAVPVSEGSEAVAALRAGVQRDMPVIGFLAGALGLGQDYDPRALPEPSFGPRRGVIVGQVQPGGPAERAGLRSAFASAEGGVDIIVAVDGERTPTFENLKLILRRKRIGQEIAVEVQRGARTVRLELTLGARRTVFN